MPAVQLVHPLVPVVKPLYEPAVQLVQAYVDCGPAEYHPAAAQQVTSVTVAPPAAPEPEVAGAAWPPMNTAGPATAGNAALT